MLNHAVLIGRLVRDPDLRYTSSGNAVCNFTLAVERKYTSQNGEKQVDFIKIIAWRKLAETCANHLSKGRLVAIEGSIQVRNSQKDGRTYVNTEIVANEVKFLDYAKDKKQDSGTGSSYVEDDDLDVPF